MSPIEEYWIQTLRGELEVCGVSGADVQVRSAEAENWRFDVAAQGRRFEIGFNHAEQLWARETTPGAEKHLVSNDHARVHASAQARHLGVRLIAAAVADPRFPPRDPPVI